MLAVARCVPSMDASGDADATDGEPVADARPDATVALGDVDCKDDPVLLKVCDGEGDSDSDTVLEAVPRCVIEPVAVTEVVVRGESDAVSVALCDNDDVGVRETLSVLEDDA